jgi:hypothetical protein
MAGLDDLTTLVERLGTVSEDDREAVKAQMQALAETFEDRTRTIEHLEHAKKALQSLELRWEVDEVIDAITPPPLPPEEEEEVPEDAPDPSAPITAADLDMVYDDPRGLALYKHKKLDRWFATRVDPQTRQPQTFELHPTEVTQLKAQLLGSPYWIKGGAA